MRENVKIRKMQISCIVYLLAKLCNIFDEAFFIDVSIHVVQYHNQINQLLVFIFSQECYTKY